MKKVNALELRHSLSKIISILEKNGGPVLLERSRRPAAVLISLRDFEERFIDRDAHNRRIAIRDSINSLARKSSLSTPTEEILRKMREES